MTTDLLSVLAAAGSGWIVGLSVAAPVGPVGVLCINRTLTRGFGSGLASGCGAATADLAYGLVTALGLSVLSSLLLKVALPVRIIGLAFLVYLGVRTFLTAGKTAKIEPADNTQPAGSVFQSFISTFFLTVTNPFTILFFVSVLTGTGAVTEDRSLTGSLFLVAGIFLGSLSWWLILSGLTALARKRIRNSWMVWINRISAAILLVLAGYLLFTLLRDIL